MKTTAWRVASRALGLGFVWALGACGGPTTTNGGGPVPTPNELKTNSAPVASASASAGPVTDPGIGSTYGRERQPAGTAPVAENGDDRAEPRVLTEGGHGLDGNMAHVEGVPPDGVMTQPEPLAPIPNQLATGPLQTGESAQYLPNRCSTRMYLNVAALAGSEAPALGKLLDKMLATMSGNDRQIGEQVLKMLRGNGLDPSTALREISACDGPDAFVVGFQNPQAVDVIALVQKMAGAMGGPSGTVEHAGAVTAWSQEYGPTIAQLGSNLLIITRRRHLIEGLTNKAGGRGLDASRHLFALSVDREHVFITLDDQAPNIAARGVIRAGSGGNAQQMLQEVQRDIGAVAGEIEQTPFKLLARPVRNAKAAVSGDDIVITATTPRSDLGVLVRSLLNLPNADLERAMPWHRYSSPGTPAGGGSKPPAMTPASPPMAPIPATSSAPTPRH